MISVNKVSFSYDGENNIFENFEFKFYDKQSYVIQGENGRGKTTLLKLLLGLLKPSEGSIEKDIEYRIGYVPDYNGLYENMTVLDNIKFRLGIYGLKYSEEKQNVENAIRRFNVSSFLYQKVKELSLGTQKKIALICALLIKPQLLVLDEPTGGLDRNTKNELIHIINEVSSEMMVISVSHSDEYIKNTNSIIVQL